MNAIASPIRSPIRSPLAHLDDEDLAEQAFEAQCFRMREWTVNYLIHQVPRDLEDRLIEILDDIAMRRVGLTEVPK